MNWVGGRYQIPSLSPRRPREATFLIKEKQLL